MTNPASANAPLEYKAVTAEQIDRAIAWYETNTEAVVSALPISVPGICYKLGCLRSIDRFALGWKDGTMPLNLAVCYVHRPLTIFYHELKGRASQSD